MVSLEDKVDPAVLRKLLKDEHPYWSTEQKGTISIFQVTISSQVQLVEDALKLTAAWWKISPCIEDF